MDKNEGRSGDPVIGGRKSEDQLYEDAFGGAEGGARKPKQDKVEGANVRKDRQDRDPDSRH